MHSFLMVVGFPGILARVRKHAEIGLQRNLNITCQKVESDRKDLA